MGTITAQSIADDAWALVNDTATTGYRWPAAEVLKAINAGQREVVTYLPSAFTKRAAPTLAAGTRQDFTGLSITDGLQVLDVPRNYAANGTTAAEAITLLEGGRRWLDENRPGWHAETPTTRVRHYFTDERDPKAFYVWPPADGTRKVELIYSATPPDVAAIGNAIALDDIYANPLMYYLLFRMRAKNKPGANSAADSAGWYALFLQALGVKDQRVRRNDQNVKGDA